MPGYTEDELKKIKELRDREREDGRAIAYAWEVAGVGYGQSDTMYGIEYRLKDEGGAWSTASPFYEPVSPRPEYTTDQQRANEIADLIFEGKWATTKQSDPSDRDIVAVRVFEVTHASRITKQRHHEGS